MYRYTHQTVADIKGADVGNDRGKAEGHGRHFEVDQNGDIDNDDNGDGNDSGDGMMVKNAQANLDGNPNGDGNEDGDGTKIEIARTGGRNGADENACSNSKHKK